MRPPALAQTTTVPSPVTTAPTLPTRTFIIGVLYGTTVVIAVGDRGDGWSGRSGGGLGAWCDGRERAKVAARQRAGGGRNGLWVMHYGTGRQGTIDERTFDGIFYAENSLDERSKVSVNRQAPVSY